MIKEAFYKDFSTYEFDYFSGSQISIYIGDILVDDIAHIQYSVSQGKKPVYSYASQYFATLAPGIILVEGTFVVPFKEADYLLEVLARFQETMRPIEKDTRYLFTPKGSQVVAQQNIERLLQETKNGKNTDKFKLIRDLAVQSDKVFEGIAEAFQDSLWKTQGTDDQWLSGNASSHNVKRETYRRADQYPPFDIWILYGDVANKAANTTIKKIIDVEIVGQGQTVELDGIVFEQYRFLAKNLS